MRFTCLFASIYKVCDEETERERERRAPTKTDQFPWIDNSTSAADTFERL